ncbi:MULTISPECIES: DUF6479 family protein [Streptomyces]|uniref:Secreted protein n=1 Tax=Streptomyces viridochromogenes TaxID=1938 RepID=A0A0L8LDI4_STRVR|nr:MULTISPECIES: DUF6479 family protein [Streptomyces]KOG36149.1 hypothetical protein ADK34_02965 [Streptomyces viridochromogenes]
MGTHPIDAGPLTQTAGVWQTGLAQVLGGLVLVTVLIGAFALGMRLRDKEVPPPDPGSQPQRPETDRPPGEMSEYRRPAEVPSTDGAHRLTPHQLKGSSTETSTEPPSEERRKWGGISSGGFGSGGVGHGD